MAFLLPLLTRHLSSTRKWHPNEWHAIKVEIIAQSSKTMEGEKKTWRHTKVWDMEICNLLSMLLTVCLFSKLVKTSIVLARSWLIFRHPFCCSSKTGLLWWTIELGFHSYVTFYPSLISATHTGCIMQHCAIWRRWNDIRSTQQTHHTDRRSGPGAIARM